MRSFGLDRNQFWWCLFFCDATLALVVAGIVAS